AIARAHPALHGASQVVSARGEWFDGTGKPHGHARAGILITAGILAAAIAYDRLDRGERIDTAAGTQFDPTVVRAMMEAAKLRA
ncbi:MAG: HD domain-containing phosphohydrolase, partial [Candidatus Aquilonibacter sp.]